VPHGILKVKNKIKIDKNKYTTKENSQYTEHSQTSFLTGSFLQTGIAIVMMYLKIALK
jgi:hypothetical protein